MKKILVIFLLTVFPLCSFETPADARGSGSFGKSTPSFRAPSPVRKSSGTSSGDNGFFMPSKPETKKNSAGAFGGSPSTYRTTTEATKQVQTVPVTSSQKVYAARPVPTQFSRQGNPVPVSSTGTQQTTAARPPEYMYRGNDSLYRNPPTYVMQSYPAFGPWDAFMLAGLLSSMNRNDTAWFYHHQEDPGAKAYLGEMKKMAEENAELKSRLDNIQKTVDEMAAQKIPVDKDYLPESIRKIDPLMYEKENIYVDGPDWKEKLEKRLAANSKEEENTSPVLLWSFFAGLALVGFFAARKFL